MTSVSNSANRLKINNKDVFFLLHRYFVVLISYYYKDYIDCICIDYLTKRRIPLIGIGFNTMQCDLLINNICFGQASTPEFKKLSKLVS